MVIVKIDDQIKKIRSNSVISSYDELLAIISSELNLSLGSFYLTCQSRPYDQSTFEPSALHLQDNLFPQSLNRIIDISLRVSGGKGGFGSLLKSQRSRFRTNNFGSMRDLNGRRLRHVEQEQQLREFVPPSEQRLREIQTDLKAIKQTGKATQKKQCYFGSECKYKHKCKYLHPKEDEHEQTPKTSATLANKSNFSRNSFSKRKNRQNEQKEINVIQKEKCREKEMEKTARETKVSLMRALNVMKSVKSISDKRKTNAGTESETKVLKKPKNSEFEHVKNEKEKPESLDKIDKKESPSNPNPDVHVESETNTEKEHKFEKIDLGDFSSPQELEILGGRILKENLMAYGLKCGGTVAERAQRLYLLKTTRLEDLPKKMFSKTKK